MRVWFKIIFLLMWLSLTGCHFTTIAPVDQVQENTQNIPLDSPSTLTRKVAKKPYITEYQCENRQKVRIQSPSFSRKNQSITLTFNQRSHKLSPMISEKGNKYTNIRWTWLVDFNGTGQLINRRYNVLAKNCVKR